MGVVHLFATRVFFSLSFYLSGLFSLSIVSFVSLTLNQPVSDPDPPYYIFFSIYLQLLHEPITLNDAKNKN